MSKYAKLEDNVFKWSFKLPCDHSHEENENPNEWIVDVKGEADRESFEISVLRRRCCHGRDSYGWFGANKLLITHNGGPCQWPLIQIVWDKMIVLANEVAEEMNKSEGIL